MRSLLLRRLLLRLGRTFAGGLRLTGSATSATAAATP